jgi:ABC-2 type transport system ATP-binding protein
MPASSNAAIAVRALTKRYGDQTALAGIDLDVPRGVCFGLLGPNGAGKSTTVGVLTTLLAPTSGSALLLGYDVVRERAAVRRQIGVVFQESALDPELSAREQLALHARLFHLDAPAACAASWIERLGLAEHADRPVRKLSGGLKRRVEIARGLLHRPGVLFLDEPTTGLDVAARARIWDELRALRKTGDTTLFLTTHSMEEADALCDAIAIVDAGRIVASGSPDALKAALGGDVVTLVLERPHDAISALEAQPGVRRVVADGAEAGGALRVTVADGTRRIAGLLECVRGAGIIEVDLRRPTLEHVFLHHTGHAFEEASLAQRAEGERSPSGWAP